MATSFSAKLINYKHVNRDKYHYTAPEDTKRGYHLSRCLYDYDMKGENMIPYYIQTPRLVTPTGLYMVDDKCYVDVKVPYGSQFLEYLTAEDEKNILATSEHSGESDWFSTHIGVDDIVDQYVSPLSFQGENEDPILRLEVPMYKRKPVCEVFDINRQTATTDLIKPGSEIFGIVSKNGIRFFSDRLSGDYTLHKVKVMVDKDDLPKDLPTGYMFDDDTITNVEPDDLEEEVETEEADNVEEDLDDEEADNVEDLDDEEDSDGEDFDEIEELTDDEVEIDISDDEEDSNDEDDLNDEEELNDEEDRELNDEEDRELNETQLEDTDEPNAHESGTDVLEGLDEVKFNPESSPEGEVNLVTDDLTKIDLEFDGGDDEEVDEDNMDGERLLHEPEELTDDELEVDISDDEEEEDDYDWDNHEQELEDVDDNTLLADDEDSGLLGDELDLLDDSDLDLDDEQYMAADNANAQLQSDDDGLDIDNIDLDDMKDEIKEDLVNRGAVVDSSTLVASQEPRELTDEDLHL